jgi:hypothetical protein
LPPRTDLGITVNAAAAAVVVLRKLRREIPFPPEVAFFGFLLIIKVLS